MLSAKWTNLVERSPTSSKGQAVVRFMLCHSNRSSSIGDFWPLGDSCMALRGSAGNTWLSWLLSLLLCFRHLPHCRLCKQAQHNEIPNCLF
jgi:hypothetical protein